MKVTFKDHIRHYTNPLHIMCRLVGIGVNKKISCVFINWYEILIYKPLLGKRKKENMMKKCILILLAVVMVLTMTTGCIGVRGLTPIERANIVNKKLHNGTGSSFGRARTAKRRKAARARRSNRGSR